MEFRRYAKVLARWWWLIASTVLIVTVASLIFSTLQHPQYRSSLTLVVSPKATLGELQTVRQSLDTLENGMIINTYTEVIRSRRIYEQARARLGESPALQSPVDVIASAVQKTNVIQLDVEGTDPAAVYAMANAVAEEAIQYIDGLYELYDVKVLDAAQEPGPPFSPNIPRNVGLGFVLGLTLGVSLAFFAEYIRSPMEAAQLSSIVDARTGLYSKPYFLQRLREEIGRSQRHAGPFAVAMLSITNPDATESLFPEPTRERLRRQVLICLKGQLSPEQILAAWDDDRLALLLPDASAEAARQAMERLRMRLASIAFEDDESGAKVAYVAQFGLSSYSQGLTERDLLSQAEAALQEASTASSGNLRFTRPALT